MASRRKQKDLRKGIRPDGRETVVYDPARTERRPVAPLAIREIPVPDAAQPGYEQSMNHYGCSDRYIRTFILGDCSVLVTREFGKLHASIAHPRRDPSWNEIRAARDAFFPRGCGVVQIIPGKDDLYVNAHAHCFHLWEVVQDAIDPYAGRETTNRG